jgi:general stress protein 26
MTTDHTPDQTPGHTTGPADGPAGEDDRRKVAELVHRARLCFLTTMTEDGKHVSRPMALQSVEFDGDLWFFTYDDDAKVRQIRANPQVNVSFSNPGDSEWTSVSGTADVVHDRAKAEELYTKYLEVWFPDGLDTPGIGLLKVHADTVEYWESSRSKVKRLIGMARAIRTDDPDKFPAENRTVEM